MWNPTMHALLRHDMLCSLPAWDATKVYDIQTAANNLVALLSIQVANKRKWGFLRICLVGYVWKSLLYKQNMTC